MKPDRQPFNHPTSMGWTRHPYADSPNFPRRVHYGVLAAGLTAAVAYGSLVPFGYRPMALAQAVDQFFRGGFFQLGLRWRQDLAINVLLFVPIGFLSLGAIDSDRRTRFGAVIAAPILLTLLGCASTVIEFSQMWFPRRSPSLGDVLAQVVGSGLGMVAWFAVGRSTTAWLRVFFARGGSVVDWRVRMLQFYLAGFAVYQLLPFDLIVSPEAIHWKIHESGRVMLMPFSMTFRNVFEMLWQWVIDVLLFAPVGMLMRVGWMAPGRMRTVVAAGGMAGAMALTVEAAQLFILSRYVDSTDIITSTLGGLIGAFMTEPIWRRLEEQPSLNRSSTHGQGGGPVRERQNQLITGLSVCGVYGVLLIASFWHPFDWVWDWGRFWQRVWGILNVPFIHFYWGNEYVAATNMIRSFMLFIPIGSVLRWGVGGNAARLNQGWLTCVIVAAVVGLTIELGQAMMLTKTADITDLVIYIAGSIAGWVLAGRWLARA